MANDEVMQPFRGGQDQVSGPQVPLLDHGDEIETLNWACKSYWPWLVDPINSYVMANSSYMPSLGSLSHLHCLEEAPVVHRPGPDHLGEIGRAMSWPTALTCPVWGLCLIPMT